MYQFVKTLALVGAAALLLDTTPMMAQDTGGRGQRNRAAQGGNGGARRDQTSFDPAQAQQRMMDRNKVTLGITNDDEWKIVQERIQKVLEAQREVRSGADMMGARRTNRQGADANPGNQDTNNRRRVGESNPVAEELRKALDDNASSETVDAKLTALRESRKAAEAKLEAARSALQKIVTRKQEARLVLMGLLK